MDEKVIRMGGPSLQPVVLEADLEPIEIDLKRTAIIVVDMINSAFRKTGYADLVGLHGMEIVSID